MEPLHLIMAVTFLLSSLLLKSLLASKPNHTSKLPLSPPSLSIIGHLHLLKKPLHHSLSRLSSQYGPIIYLHFGYRPTVVISSHQLAEECFTTNDMALANRPNFPSLREVTNNYSTLSASNYGPLWRNLRKIATLHVLSSRCLLSSMSARNSGGFRQNLRNDEARHLVHRLFFGLADGKSAFKQVNVKAIAFEYVLNVVMGMTAGKRYYSEEAKDWEEARQFRQVIDEVSALVSVSRLVDFYPWFRILDFVSVRRIRLQAATKRRNELSQTLIDQIRKGINTQQMNTMIGDLLELQNREPEVYTDDLIRSLDLNLVQAGTDTSSNTIEWAMSLLLNNLATLAKAQHEIDMVVGRERLVEESDIPNLPYLQAIINETLRLRPAVPLDVPHQSATDCYINGYKIPSGTTLLVNIHAIHQDPIIWKDPTEFRPERFENGKAEGTWFMPFGMGRRKCPGEGLAIRMIALALGIMIQCFEWKRTGEEAVDMTESPGIVMAKAIRLDAMYRPRPEMAQLLGGF